MSDYDGDDPLQWLEAIALTGSIPALVPRTIRGEPDLASGTYVTHNESAGLELHPHKKVRAAVALVACRGVHHHATEHGADPL